MSGRKDRTDRLIKNIRAALIFETFSRPRAIHFFYALNVYPGNAYSLVVFVQRIWRHNSTWVILSYACKKPRHTRQNSFVHRVNKISCHKMYEKHLENNNFRLYRYKKKFHSKYFLWFAYYIIWENRVVTWNSYHPVLVCCIFNCSFFLNSYTYCCRFFFFFFAVLLTNIITHALYVRGQNAGIALSSARPEFSTFFFSRLQLWQ